MENQSIIEELVFPNNVRQSPQMLLGDLRDASVLYRECLDNSRDELIASKLCNHVWCKTDGNFHIVADNGRGIPVAVDRSGNKTQLELACASIYSSGKYHSDTVQSGRHGIGLSAVNAVSNKFKIASKITYQNWDKSLDWIKKDVESYIDPNELTGNELWLYLEFEKGIKVKEMVANYKDLQEQFDENIPEQISTIVGFTSDDTIINSNKVKFLDSWYEYTFFVLKEFYNKDINITLNGVKLKSNFNPYKFRIKKHVELVHPDWAEVNKDFDIFLSFEFSKDLSESSESGCVNMITVNRGLHINIATNMITENLKKRYNIEHNFLTSGLKLDVIFLAKKLGFDSQVKTRLVTVDGLSTDDWSCLDNEIQTIFSENNEEIEAHVRALQELADSYKSISSRDYISQMITINSTLDSNRVKSFQPIKLIDASAPDYDRSNTELFLVEGNSAMGSIMKVRDPYYHAVMPLRGVVLNSSWVNFDGLMENEEVCDIISAIGSGVDHEDCYDLNALRYDKIIIATDADKDGCFVGETKISLVNGTEVPIRELYEKYPNGGFYVYSRDKYGNVVPGYVQAVALTKHVNKLYKLTLDNDEVVYGTGNHPFMLKNHEFKRLDQLKVGESLSPLYRSLSKAPGDFRPNIGDYNKDSCYEFFYDENTDKMVPTHREFCVEGEYLEGEVNQVHHKDHNPRNNDPRNLIVMTAGEHRRLHLIEYNQSNERLEAIRNSDLFIESSRRIMTDYNKSVEHRERVSALNSEDWMIKCQRSGKIYRTIIKLIKFNLPITILNYEALRGWKFPSVSYDELLECYDELTSDSRIFDKYNNLYNLSFEEELEEQESNFSELSYTYLSVIGKLIYAKLDITSENFYKFKDSSMVSYIMYNSRLKLEGLLRLSKSLQEKFIEIHSGKCIEELYGNNNYDHNIFYHNLAKLKTKGVELSKENYLKEFDDSLLFYFDKINDLENWFNNYNHKVKSIEVIECESVPVYNLSVKEYENYALTAGVFVHNCHIQALLLGLFAGHMSYLIKAGKIFVLESPFYKQDGQFIYPDEADKLDKSRSFERFKGLGSLKATTPQARQEIVNVFVNPDTRRLVQVTEEGIDRAVMTLGDKYTRKILMESLNLIETR